MTTAVPTPKMTGASDGADAEAARRPALLGRGRGPQRDGGDWVMARGGRLKAAVPLRRGLPRTGASRPAAGPPGRAPPRPGPPCPGPTRSAGQPVALEGGAVLGAGVGHPRARRCTTTLAWTATGSGRRSRRRRRARCPTCATRLQAARSGPEPRPPATDSTAAGSSAAVGGRAGRGSEHRALAQGDLGRGASRAASTSRPPAARWRPAIRSAPRRGRRPSADPDRCRGRAPARPPRQ